MTELLHNLQGWEGTVASYVFSFRKIRETRRFSVPEEGGENLFIYEFKKSM